VVVDVDDRGRHHRERQHDADDPLGRPRDDRGHLAIVAAALGVGEEGLPELDPPFDQAFDATREQGGEQRGRPSPGR
jgi:hypothetical protein